MTGVALLDVVGIIPLVGDGIKGVSKGSQIAAKMKQVDIAIKAAKVRLVRTKMGLSVSDIKKTQASTTDAAKNCAVQRCPKKKSNNDGDIGQKNENSSLNEAFHYTEYKWKKAINENGLRSVSYATPAGNLSPTQAAIELALPPNRNLPNAKLRINLDALRKDGYKIPQPKRVSNVVTADDGRVYTQPSGGYEMKFDYEIPTEYISIVE